MEITVLGSGTAVPDRERGSPGIAVHVEGLWLFLDLGSGSLYRAVRYGVPVEQVDSVLLTHLHPDHTGDLVPLLFAFRNPEVLREKDLFILGPEGVQRFFKKLQDVYGDWMDAHGYRLEVKPFGEKTRSFGNCTMRCCPVRHGTPAIAYEIKDSKGMRLVYSGDTGICDTLAAFAVNADLLILECSFPDGCDRDGHLTPSQAGWIAGQAKCKKLLLTHFYPACRGEDLVTPCREFYQGPIVLAEDGLRMQLA